MTLLQIYRCTENGKQIAIKPSGSTKGIKDMGSDIEPRGHAIEGILIDYQSDSMRHHSKDNLYTSQIGNVIMPTPV